MQIKKLFLQNFRNYENETFTFDSGLNVLFGKNAQGKTNCAEAVFYLCTGASLRIRHDNQLIRMGAEYAKITAEALAALRGKADALARYYASREWKRDFADDEAGRLPKDLKRGVLSEDGIYNALEAYRERTEED